MRLHFHVPGCSLELQADSKYNQVLHIQLDDFGTALEVAAKFVAAGGTDDLEVA